MGGLDVAAALLVLLALVAVVLSCCSLGGDGGRAQEPFVGGPVDVARYVKRSVESLRQPLIGTLDRLSGALKAGAPGAASMR